MTTTPLALSHSRNVRERQASRRCASSGAGRPAAPFQSCAACLLRAHAVRLPWISVPEQNWVGPQGQATTVMPRAVA
jgi:hypothetical protein